MNSFYTQLTLMLLAVAGGAFWWTSLKARELAVAAARQHCQRQQVQFLDQTVALARIKPIRLDGGSLGWQRDYRFEFTDDGARRDSARMTLHGSSVRTVQFPFTRDADGSRIYTH